MKFKVGIFDSGIGGFTVLNSLLKTRRDVDVFYLADVESLDASWLSYNNKPVQFLLDPFSINYLHDISLHNLYFNGVIYLDGYSIDAPSVLKFDDTHNKVNIQYYLFHISMFSHFWTGGRCDEFFC